ncbi:MAG: type II toxin-antitoxin system HicB family antitoxin [Treponema sp.]|nr:type II toxin-antitoxin system HicB family antitoxin [Treponema sp.]MCL2250705.1 type II toxin-antitoxin system HicB family antitoxin [Treponema sp.]
MMKYKNYTGKAEYDDEAEIFYGEVIGLRDVVTFKGTSVKELKKSFKESIDDYLAFCERMNKAPDIPASGKLILRISPELHSYAAITAKAEGMSLNSWVAEALKDKLYGGDH